MKMRKFPDQGSSKLLWGRAPPQGGGTSPPPWPRMYINKKDLRHAIIAKRDIGNA